MKHWPLFAILLIGIITPLAATALFYLVPPQESVENGELLPPLAVPWRDDIKKGKWTLLHLADSSCDDRCRRRLCRMRQVRLMLPGNYLRVQREWLLADGGIPAAQRVANDCGEPRAAAYAAGARQVDVLDGVMLRRQSWDWLPTPAAGLSRQNYLYLIDPDGFLVMRFAPELDLYAIKKDLYKLLKLSKGRRRIAT